MSELSQSELERRTLALCWRETERAHEVIPEIIYDPELREALTYIQALVDEKEWPSKDSNILDLLNEIGEESIPVNSTTLAACMKKVQARRFPLEALPEPIRSFVADVAKVHQLPPELPGAMALAVVSAAMGKGIFLNNVPHRTPPNLFFLTTARSGTGKSECYRSVTRPLYQLETELTEAFVETGDRLESEKQLLEAEARSLRSGKGKQTPTERHDQLTAINRRLREIVTESAPPRLIAEDATGPQLAAMLAARNETLALFSPEAGEVVSNISGRHNATGRTDETLLLKSFSLEPHAQDRVTTGATNLKEPCLAVLLACTPIEAAGLFDSERFTVGGLMPRFLICSPETKWQRKDGTERQLDPKLSEYWRKLIHGLAKVYRLRSDEPAMVEISAEAAELLRAFWNSYADRQDEFAGQEAFAARHNEQAARIALVLHTVKAGIEAGAIPLPESTMEAAIEIQKFFITQQQKMLAQGVKVAREGRLEALREALKRYPDRQATMRDLERRNGFQRQEIEQVKAMFPDSISIIETIGPRGGRPTKVVTAM